ncbi:ABC transporter ATP-binding protein [Sciscionella sediminilitoris]|uniref:ABC transporter ATP-binding protein n=1 Tax=Sciscionella sediminilitoris TaxID=1445613 RepID=UPI0004DEDE40|nr:ABC transporter ATP-binding protein [Sciscionella sp. SE31]
MDGLELRGLAAGYGGDDKVAGVDLTVPPGSWLAIVGPNGAGKSTLLKATAGLIPHRGEVSLDGTTLAGLGRRKRARAHAYAPQTPQLPAGLTVTDYALLGRTPYLGPFARESAADLRIVADVLLRLDLSELADRALHTLSGGERQRAVLARALAQQAEVLLLDEPTTGLDIGHAQSLLDLVDRLRTDDGSTVVTTLHDLTLAMLYADTVLLLDSGRAVASGPPAEVLTPEVLWQHYGARVEALRTADGRTVLAPVR